MNLEKEIKKLVQYGLDHQLIQPEDTVYTINQYLEILQRTGHFRRRDHFRRYPESLA